MSYTVIPKNDDPWHDCETWEEGLAYCKEKGYVTGRDALIEEREGDIE